MGDVNYKRTRGERNKLNKMAWIPGIKNGIATMRDGRHYRVRPDGWRRVRA